MPAGESGTAYSHSPHNASETRHFDHPHKVMLGLYIGAFLGMLSETSMNIALPDLMDEFSVSSGTAQWMVVGYMLAIGVVLPCVGFMLKWIKAKTLVLFALTCFLVGALVCTVATGFPVLLAGRIVQGISTGIRGMCVYNDQLVISNVTMDAATGKSSATLLISSDPEKGFTQIADSDSLFNYPAYRYSDSIYGGSIWDMVEYNNSLYVSICTGTEDNMPNNNTMQSFALVRGDQNADGTFTWTPVAGDQKKDGARYTFGIDPERTRSGAANLMVFNDYLYIGEYNDEEIALERILFSKTGKNADGQFGGGLDCRFLNANLDQSVNLYRMDKNENMELVVGNSTKMFPNGSLSGLKSGFGRNENQYIWRMEVYDGKLYVGTHDASSLLECFGQFVNGNLLKRTPSEWKDQWNYLKALMEALATVDPNGTGNPDALAQTIKFSYNFVFKNITVRNIASAIKLLNYLRTAKRGFDLYVTEDGVNFETITIDGFGDPYNHGLRVFATTDQGLCLGTANPFYGTQIWIQRKAD